MAETTCYVCGGTGQVLVGMMFGATYLTCLTCQGQGTVDD